MNKKIALLLIFTLFFNITAAAQNDPAEETLVFNETTLSSGGFFAETGENAAIKWTTQISKSFSSGFCSCVLYKNHVYTAADKKIYKIDSSTGKIVKTAALYGTIGYTYYMAQAEDKIFVQLKNGIIQAFSADTLESLWISEEPKSGAYGQGISPICYDNGHIYACTAVMSKNYGKGAYFCLDTADEKPDEQFEIKNFIWQLEAEENNAQTSGFYGAGAAVSGENIVFGSEGGTVYLADKTGGSIKDRFEVGADVRSAAVYDGKNVYFTAKDGSLYSAEITDNGFGEVKSQKFCVSSSCEPVIKNGRIYAGGTEGGYANGVFCVFDASSLEILAKFDVSGNVQARPLALENSSGVNVYFTCNNTPGKVMRLTDTENSFDISEFFTPSEEYAQYCINRVNTDGGALYYQNDSGILIALELAENAEPVSEPTTAETFTETTTLTENTTETTTRASSHSGGGGGSHTAQYINVAFEIIGDTPHGEEQHNSNTVWLSNDIYKIEKGSNAEDLVLKALDKNGFEYVIHSNGYISEITSPDGVRLAEFTNGINSGWMYTKNGEFVQSALRGCTLNDGDTLVLLYSDDYTKTDNSMRYSSSNEAATE
ncbi:MAG: PQQ-binding-like beta-propeller repeat protein, partial [Firmicutes bacterium]|nr:PQQ-binding-like beta-propeller repeat protein [Bacillota bacterium]